MLVIAPHHLQLFVHLRTLLAQSTGSILGFVPEKNCLVHGRQEAKSISPCPQHSHPENVIKK